MYCVQNALAYTSCILRLDCPQRQPASLPHPAPCLHGRSDVSRIRILLVQIPHEILISVALVSCFYNGGSYVAQLLEKYEALLRSGRVEVHC